MTQLHDTIVEIKTLLESYNILGFADVVSMIQALKVIECPK